VTDDNHGPGAARPAGALPGAPSGVPTRDAVGLEALGLLASGIAHDFNNILAAVRGNVGLAREALSGLEPDVVTAHADLAEVELAVARASALVRQLLAIGRRQARAPEPLDLNTLVRDAAAMLRMLMGEEIRVALRLPPSLPPAYADRSQVEQVLMNLALNGRDAIVDAAAGRDDAPPVGTPAGRASSRGASRAGRRRAAAR
jgi:signal transduction histidine kinase